MYHTVGTGLTIIVLYSISYIFWRNGFYTVKVHRIIWNIILAVAFILTAFGGIFLGLQITYKWNIPFIEKILKWHAEIGIGMAITGFFHLLWHLSYYKGLFRKSDTEITEIQASPEGFISEIPLNLFIIGFISSSVQLLLMKEMINIAGGYELIAGTFLCSWLIASALGTGLARLSAMDDLKKINMWFSLAPLISIFLLMLLSRMFLNTGETPSFLVSAVISFLVLIPFCLLSGFAFIKLVNAGAAAGYTPGSSFSTETIGGIAAGVSVAFLSSGILNTYQALLLIILAGIIYTINTYYLKESVHKIVFKTIGSVAMILIIIYSPDILFRQLLLKGTRVDSTIDTPYGNITRAVFKGDTSIYYNQRLLIYNNDIVESEEDIHYAMLQTDNPENVLIISGPVDSRLSELRKYKVRKIVFVERDPFLAKLEQPGIKENGVFFIENKDALSYIRNTEEIFDAIILLLPPPSSLSLNRYYTVDFFNEVRKKLSSNGVFSCSPGTYVNYLNTEAVNLYSTIYNSLKEIFKDVLPIAGNKLYFIASNKELSASVCELSVRKNIKNTYVGPDYLSDDLIEAKTAEIGSLINSGIATNTFDRPVASFFYQELNLSKNLNMRIPSVIFLLLLIVTSIRSVRKENGVMFLSAFALAGFEIIMILVLQLAVGNMFQVTGLILAGFMAGLATGSGMKSELISGNKIWVKLLILIAFYIIATLSIELIVRINNNFTEVILIILLGFIPAVITGRIFRDMTSHDIKTSLSSSIYKADLSGSALGFLVFPTLTLPVLGLSFSLLLLPVMIFAGLLFQSITRKN